MTFDLVEVCAREQLRTLEQKYINEAKGRLMNLDKEVCELASSESHAKRMRGAWSKRSPEAKAALAAKISATLKRRYAENPEMLRVTRQAGVKARAARAARPTPAAERIVRSEAARQMWIRRKAIA